MKKINRIRQQIIELNSEKIYLNESMAEKDLNISRYFIRKSLKENIPVRGYMFAPYSYSMDKEFIKVKYLTNKEQQLLRSNKWKKLMN